MCACSHHATAKLASNTIICHNTLVLCRSVSKPWSNSWNSALDGMVSIKNVVTTKKEESGYSFFAHTGLQPHF
jgi:hypothetical protein